MKMTSRIAVILMSASVLGGSVAAYAQEKPAEAKQATAEKAADKDVGRLSEDGRQALMDIQATRLAIFNADPAAAKDAIAKAKAEMQKASKDDAVYMKAESELQSLQPPKDAKAGEAAKASAGKEPVAWLPVDAQLSLGEDFQATPEKTAAVAEANKHFQNKDRKGALEKLRLADVDVQFMMAVLPLEKTVSEVNQAQQLIDQGKFYEANAALKDTMDGMRLDILDANGHPYKAPAHKADANAPKAATPEAQPKPAN